MGRIIVDLPKYATKVGIALNVGEIVLGAGTVILASYELAKGLRLRKLLLK